MLKTNTTLQKLLLRHPYLVDEQIMEREVKPRLRANLFRARIGALMEEEREPPFQLV